MIISRNNTHKNRFDIGGVQEPETAKKSGIAGFHEGICAIIGWIACKIFRKAVRVEIDKKVYFLNCKSLENWRKRVAPDAAAAKNMHDPKAVQEMIERIITAKKAPEPVQVPIREETPVIPPQPTPITKVEPKNIEVEVKKIIQPEQIEVPLLPPEDKISAPKEPKDLAKQYCLEGKYDEAKECLTKAHLYYSEGKKIFEDVAEEYYNNGYLEESLEVLSNLDDKHTDRAEELYIYIGKKYLEQDNLDQAASAFLKSIYRSQVQGEYLSKIAQKYYDKKEYAKALDYTIHFENLGKAKSLLIRIAEDCEKSGDHKLAMEAIRNIQTHGKLMDVGMSNGLRDYLAKGGDDFEKAINIVHHSSLRKTY